MKAIEEFGEIESSVQKFQKNVKTRHFCWLIHRLSRTFRSILYYVRLITKGEEITFMYKTKNKWFHLIFFLFYQRDSYLKTVNMFSINPHLGPLQISLGRMIIDIIKFFFIYMLVLFAFGCGMNQLLWYYADMERKVCYSLPNGGADFDNNREACIFWRRFAKYVCSTKNSQADH